MRLASQCWSFGCQRTGSNRLCGASCPEDECGFKNAVETEVFAPHRWEDRTSSDGVPIQVSRLRPSSLVRR